MNALASCPTRRLLSPSSLLGVTGGHGLKKIRDDAPPSWVFAMSDENTTAAVQRYLNALACEEVPEPIVRALLARAVRRLHLLCANLLYRSYPRLTKPPLNLETDEMLGGVVEGLLKAMRSARPQSVRQFFAMANQHMRWQLNDLARRLDKEPAVVEVHEELVPRRLPAAPESLRKDAACWKRSTTCLRRSAKSSAWCAPGAHPNRSRGIAGRFDQDRATAFESRSHDTCGCAGRPETQNAAVGKGGLSHAEKTGAT